jgi:murein DD-endopeptidase MepM/ murein hydrolase activator NlpD
MLRPVLAVLALALALTAPALGDDIAKKQAVDSKISGLQSTLQTTRNQETALRGEIDGVTARIRGLEAQVGDVSLQLQTLEQDLSLHRSRLSKLTQLYHLQTERLNLLKQQYRLSVDRLNQRLVAIYESDDPSTLDVVLGAGSLEDALDLSNYLTKIGEEDRRIAQEVADSKHAVALARKKTARIASTIRGETRAIAARQAQALETRDALVGAKQSLDTTRQQKLVALSSLTASERAEAGEIDALQAVSASLGDQIRAAQAKAAAATAAQGQATDATPSSAGLVWPVSGPITSPFGWRWGRMHEGIDIGVGYGTPIHAAASGTVIYCGWESGYGNLTVIDHGNNLATAYGHQSSIAVTCGEQVSQGQVIGYVGCTGHCFGPHLHFEVRIDGNPVDPLGYL